MMERHGCSAALCPNGKCRATGECQDIRSRPGGVTPIEERHLHPIDRTVPYCRHGVHLGTICNACGIPLLAPEDDLVNPKTLMGARRVDLSLLPAAGVIHGAHAMMDGAVKYNPYNWREKKVPARTYIAAAMRHLLDFLDGEETAADSGVHHLGHVIGCCAIMLDAMETGNLIDDRPKRGESAAILARLEKVLAARGARA